MREEDWQWGPRLWPSGGSVFGWGEGLRRSKPFVEVDPLHPWVAGPDFLLQFWFQAADWYRAADVKGVKISLFTLVTSRFQEGWGGYKKWLMTNEHFPGSEIDLVGFHLPLLWEQRTAQWGGKHQAAKRREAQQWSTKSSDCLH